MQNYYIVREHPIRIIQKCRAHSKGTLWSFLLGMCIIYVLLNWIPEILSEYFTTTNIDLMKEYMDLDPQMARSLPSTSLVKMLYVILFSGVFKLSESLYTLTYIRNRKVEYRAISEGFSLYGKALAAFVLEMLFIVLWSFLFIIPGLIAAINYSQTFYILADDPSKSVIDALKDSKMMMQGNKMNYVRLYLYYLPYIMLGYVPMFLLLDVALAMSISGVTLLIINLLTEIPVFMANGYFALGKCTFYELLFNEGFAYFRYEGQDAFREDEKKE